MAAYRPVPARPPSGAATLLRAGEPDLPQSGFHPGAAGRMRGRCRSRSRPRTPRCCRTRTGAARRITSPRGSLPPPCAGSAAAGQIPLSPRHHGITSCFLAEWQIPLYNPVWLELEHAPAAGRPN